MEIIKYDKVSYSYPNGFQALDDINFSINKGESIAIIGQNGAGKTTTVKMMNNLLKTSSGKVEILGEEISKYTTAQLAKRVGFVFQNPDDQIFHNTVREEIAFGPRILGFDEEKVERLIESSADVCGLTDVLEENPYQLPLSIRKFVAIASILAMDTEILVLDEPTAGQDMYGTKRISNILSDLIAKGKTVITITHDMEFVANNFEKVFVMSNKKLLMIGSPKEVFYNDEIIKQAMLKRTYVVDLAKSLVISEEQEVLSDEDLIDAIISISK